MVRSTVCQSPHHLSLLPGTAVIFVRLSVMPYMVSTMWYLLFGTIGVVAATYMMFPVVFILIYFRMEVFLSGMTLKYQKVDGLNICYGEKGKPRKDQASIILVHGFTADKFMWVALVKNLAPGTHVVAVDLPGHGDSDTPTDDQDISHEVTVQKMKRFLNQSGLDREPFHLVGMSMGGALAGLYAAEFPEDIHSLTMICPAMKTPKQSPFWEQMLIALEGGPDDLPKNCDLLFPENARQVEYMLDFVQYHKMWVPKQILQGVADMRKKYYPFYSRLFKTLADPRMHDVLKTHLQHINAPTQVIWGSEDKVIDPSGADLLQELLPNCVQVDLIPRCGHSISTDRPGAMTKAIITFRQKVQTLTR